MPKHNTYEQDENISDNGIVFGDVKAAYDSFSNTITVVSFSSGVPSDDLLVNAVIKVEYY